MIKYVIISLPRRISLIGDKREIRMAFSIWNSRERRICMYGGMYMKVFVSYDENADVWVILFYRFFLPLYLPLSEFVNTDGTI